MAEHDNFSPNGWIRRRIRISFLESEPDPVRDEDALIAANPAFESMDDKARAAEARKWIFRSPQIELSAKQEVNTNSVRGSDLEPYLTADTQSPPNVEIPQGSGGETVSGKYLLADLDCEDTQQGGKSIVAANWYSLRPPVLIRKQAT